MGGCCCTPKGTELTIAAAHNYYPSALEDHAPSHNETAPMLSSGLLVDTNLDTSISDTYRPPPVPVPYDVVLGHPQTPPGIVKTTGNKSDAVAERTNSGSAGEEVGNHAQDNSVKCEDLKLPDFKGQTDVDLETEKDEIQLAKSVEPIISPAEECPTCLEEYDDDNPKIVTKCDHHFHLACILEWLERSDTCPVCDQEMVFNPPIN